MVPSPDRWMWVSCHDEIVQMASKKQSASASAGSPIDFVLVHGSVRLAQDFISCWKFSIIDFSSRLRSGPGCRRQLIKPSELAFVPILEFYGLKLQWISYLVMFCTIFFQWEIWQTKYRIIEFFPLYTAANEIIDNSFRFNYLW